METFSGEPLDVTVDGVVIEPGEVSLWSASSDGRKLVLIVPESAGCTIRVEVSKIDEPSKIIEVMATHENQDSCATNLLLTPKHLIVDTDVRGFAVNVRIDNAQMG